MLLSVWKGDLAGWKVRSPRKGGGGNAPGKKKGPGYVTRTKKGEQAELKSVSALVIIRDFNGKVKNGVKPPKKGGGSIRRFWNNGNQSIAGSGFDGSYRAARYS
ncbi:MAG TPA: hypothetical protein VGC36_14045, partial [Rhizomicrobium sp.]